MLESAQEIKKIDLDYLDHEIRQIWFSTQLKKENLFFYFPECVCFLNRMGQNSDLSAFTSKIQVFYRPEWTKGDSMKTNFDIFQIQK